MKQLFFFSLLTALSATSLAQNASTPANNLRLQHVSAPKKVRHVSDVLEIHFDCVTGKFSTAEGVITSAFRMRGQRVVHLVLKNLNTATAVLSVDTVLSDLALDTAPFTLAAGGATTNEAEGGGTVKGTNPSNSAAFKKLVAEQVKIAESEINQVISKANKAEGKTPNKKIRDEVQKSINKALGEIKTKNIGNIEETAFIEKFNKAALVDSILHLLTEEAQDFELPEGKEMLIKIDAHPKNVEQEAKDASTSFLYQSKAKAIARPHLEPHFGFGYVLSNVQSQNYFLKTDPNDSTKKIISRGAADSFAASYNAFIHFPIADTSDGSSLALSISLPLFPTAGKRVFGGGISYFLGGAKNLALTAGLAATMKNVLDGVAIGDHASDIPTRSVLRLGLFASISWRF